ncbi:hypothetical protein G5I_07943 [Acromyrmex echinatior]|uniref:Uncharacterized protein n=1 Tax=Acromyrmex echinatior TaxID=103372 RepID=F4WQ07_ACREC|nr:hypothetical protein G5I_07943 [Acromyrmex echinatior]
MARLKKHFEMLRARAIRSRDFVSAEMAICKSFNDINDHNANALQDCLEKDNGSNLYEGRPREERVEFIITSASSRYVVGKMARGEELEASRTGCRPRERRREKEPKEETERKKEGDLGSNASRQRVPFLAARE